MKLTLTLMLLLTPVMVQNPMKVCPCVLVSCSSDVSSQNSGPITFKAYVKGGEPIKEISYDWMISKGKILSGQGTSEIVVEAEGKDREGLNGLVIIGGFDSKVCKHMTASCSTPLP